VGARELPPEDKIMEKPAIITYNEYEGTVEAPY
jgi:hypothetical protein